MRRWLLFFILLAAMVPPTVSAAGPLAISGEPIDPVELVQGWQMVSFPILEPMLVERFDLLDRTDNIRLTFAEAYAAGWVDCVLHYYDTDGQAYGTAGIGRALGCPIDPTTRYIEPNRGYWLYVHSDHTLQMVPTYDITDYWLPISGGTKEMAYLAPWLPGLYRETSALDDYLTPVCEIPCHGLYSSEAPWDGGVPAETSRSWYALDEEGVRDVGADDYDPSDGYRLVPPLLFRNRMYPGEDYTQQITLAPCCTCPGEEMTWWIRLAGTARVNTVVGELVCLKLELEETLGDESNQIVVWFARGIGWVRILECNDGVLDEVQELTSWTPPPG